MKVFLRAEGASICFDTDKVYSIAVEGQSMQYYCLNIEVERSCATPARITLYRAKEPKHLYRLQEMIALSLAEHEETHEEFMSLYLPTLVARLDMPELVREAW